jgi:hypothetical protein
MIGGFSEDALREFQSLASKTTGADYDFTECVDVFDFRLCQRNDGSYYGTAGKCRIGKEVARNAVIQQIAKNLQITPKQQMQLQQLGDKSLLRLIVKSYGKQKQVLKNKGLLLPEEAKKFADFYENGAKVTPVRNTDINDIRNAIDSGEILKSTVLAAGNKGRPRFNDGETIADYGWASNRERAEAVIKFILDHDSRDAVGIQRDWKTELQLDHRVSLSMGGKDEPSNWVLLPIAANQKKGDIEKRLSRQMEGKTLKEKESLINSAMAGAMRENAKMSSDDVKKLHAEGESEKQRKERRVGALKAELPIMPKAERIRAIERANKEELKLLFKASTRGAHRLKKAKGGRGDYPRVGAMKALLKLRWGETLTSADKEALRVDAVGQGEGYSQKLLKALAPEAS